MGDADQRTEQIERLQISANVGALPRIEARKFR
jgi:hypothetical protein